MSILSPLQQCLRSTARFYRQLPVLSLFLVFFLVCPEKQVYAEEQTTLSFCFEKVIDIARNLAAEPYTAPPGISEELRNLSYDAWRDIRFQPDKSLWRDENLFFELQFFHPGFVYDRTVRINVVDNGEVSTLTATKEMFDYGNRVQTLEIPEKIGFAGLRIHGPINTPHYRDEIAVFLGASYLRSLARHHNYGLSARGLAVDTASAEGEEFPWFKEFWIAKPSPQSKFLEIHALLDSRRVSGAYRYSIFPGIKTIIKVESVLFLREPVAKIGFGPLTSMFFFGENSNQRKFDDFRPEVHDSDGLQILFDHGEWLWRPLQNPVNLQVNSFEATNVRGFGLMQRDQDFANYQDLEAHYEKRPSVWVVPRGDWGPGHVELVQIPTQDEIHDNIVAHWVPAQPLEPGKPIEMNYEMRWMNANRILPPLGYVVSTRTGFDTGKKRRIFVVEFDGKPLRNLPSNAVLEAEVWAGGGTRITDRQVFRNPVTKTWRLAFQIEQEKTSTLEQIIPAKRPLIELRAALKQGETVITETWSYAFKP